ncbi:MmgE/PrpD family protein [Pseudochelatococcus lubricantis]|uniref:MmgE/PrpD family protein n=1 Tax=Pseudochelatococcus lubricantis TaxID=1538102 RepID=UPI0035EA0BA6
MTTHSQNLSTFLSGLARSDLPEEVASFVTERIIDTVGVMVAGSVKPHSKVVLATARELYGEGPITVTGEAKGLPLLEALLVNATMAHGIDFDDGHNFLHPGCVSVPASLGFAQHVEASGAQVIRAVAAGYEASIRASLAAGIDHRIRGYHPTATCNIFGAAAAGGLLLGLDPEHMEWALAIASTESSGLGQYKHDGSPIKHLHAGIAARKGAQAAFLARNGLRGFAEAFEGDLGFLQLNANMKNVVELDADLGSRYELLKTETKLYPSCRQTSCASDLALDLYDLHGLRPEAVERIEVRVPEWAMKEWHISNEMPANNLRAILSITYCVAAAIRHGRLTVAEFEDSALQDPVVAELIDKITVHEGTEETKGWPPLRGASADVWRTDGTKISVRSKNAKGSPTTPLTGKDLRAKFMSLAAPVLGEDKAGELHGLLAEIGQQPRIDPILALLRGPTRH